MNLEKKRGNQNQIRKLVFDEKEIDGDEETKKNFRLKVYNFIEKRLWHMCFHKQFADVLRTLILWNADRLLLLKYILKIKTAAPDKFLEAADWGCFSN